MRKKKTAPNKQAGADAEATIAKIAKKAYPNMHIVEVVHAADEPKGAPDAVVEELPHPRHKGAAKKRAKSRPNSDVRTVVLEPNSDVDAPIRRRSIVVNLQKKREIGAEG